MALILAKIAAGITLGLCQCLSPHKICLGLLANTHLALSLTCVILINIYPKVQDFAVIGILILSGMMLESKKKCSSLEPPKYLLQRTSF